MDLREIQGIKPTGVGNRLDIWNDIEQYVKDEF